MSTGVNSGGVGSGGIGTAGNPATGGTGLNLFSNPEDVYRNFRRISLVNDKRSGRGVLRGLSTWGLNLSLGKETRFTERVRFVVTADIFNVTNSPVFVTPGLSLANQAGFGNITAAGGNRQIQVGGRFSF
jgi:hypothetical protein